MTGAASRAWGRRAGCCASGSAHAWRHQIPSQVSTTAAVLLLFPSLSHQRIAPAASCYICISQSLCRAVRCDIKVTRVYHTLSNTQQFDAQHACRNDTLWCRHAILVLRCTIYHCMKSGMVHTGRAGHSQVKEPPDVILTKVVSTAGSDLQISSTACLMQSMYTPKVRTFLQEVTAV